MPATKHLFVSLADVVRSHAANVKRVGAHIDKLVAGWAQGAGSNPRQLKIWLTKLRSAYQAGLIDPPARGRPRENEFVRTTVQQAYTVKDLEGEAKYVVKVVTRAKDRDSWQAALDVVDMHTRGARRSLEHIAERLEEAATKLMPERFQLGPFTIVDHYGLPENRARPWFEAVTRATRLLESKQLGYLLYGEIHLAQSNQWGGLYESKTDVVTVEIAKNRADVKSLIGTLVHELGHRLWFRFLGPGARDKFSAPWIDRDEATRLVWEQYREAFTLPPGEPQEAFDLVWRTRYDFKAFNRWVRESPERLLRWQRYGRSVYTGPEPEEEIFRNGKLNKVAFDRAAKKVARWTTSDPDPGVNESRQDSLERYRKRQERVWTDTGEYRKTTLTYQEVENLLEPHGLTYQVDPKEKKAEPIRDLLRIKPVEFSVTPYGNTNRREDFAETFQRVLLGREYPRVQQRLQSVLPRGRVISVVEEVADCLTREGRPDLAVALKLPRPTAPSARRTARQSS